MRTILLIIGLIAASPAAAKVSSVSTSGFELSSSVTVKAPPATVYERIGRIGEWWDAAHSYSGKASNLSLDLRAGGCFCEALPNGGVEHMRVINALPGRLVRLQGALGPLQADAVAGILTWSLKPSSDGTEISQTYRVSGTIPEGADKIAPLADQVLEEQLQRLATSLGR